MRRFSCPRCLYEAIFLSAMSALRKEVAVNFARGPQQQSSLLKLKFLKSKLYVTKHARAKATAAQDERQKRGGGGGQSWRPWLPSRTRKVRCAARSGVIPKVASTTSGWLKEDFERCATLLVRRQILLSISPDFGSEIRKMATLY